MTEITIPRGTPKLFQSRVRTAWLFVTPLLIILAMIAAWPLLRSIWFSFTDANLKNLGGANFIGLDNYIGEYGVLLDPKWWNAVKNTLIFTVISVSIETTLGLVFAMMLNTESRVKTLLRAAVLVPWAIPTIVSSKMWSWILHDQFGLMNHVLMSLNIINHNIAWTGDPHLSLWTVVLVDVWKTTPFMSLLILAALQMLPSDCYEAAKVDGIPDWKVFKSVTLPLIMPGIGVAMVFRMLDAMRIFDLIYVLTSNNEATMSMSVFVREQMVSFQQVGYGSAASTVLFLIISVVTVIYLTATRTKFE